MNPTQYSSISFPALGIQVNPGRGFALGSLTIHYYGLVIALYAIRGGGKKIRGMIFVVLGMLFVKLLWELIAG